MPGAVADRPLSPARADSPARRGAGIVGLVFVLVSASADSALAQTDMPAAPLPVVPPLVMGAQLGAGWRVVTLPQQKPPITRFAAERAGGRLAVRIDADASYGNLVHEPAAGSRQDLPRHLAWSWRLQTPNPAVDLTSKAGDDLPAKVCLSFDQPLSRVPFFERQLMRMARARSGENLSAATLCWVWGGVSAHETSLANPFTRRVRYIVLRNNTDPANTWFEEKRDVAADFMRAFGDEASAPPPLAALIVGGDADNTGAHSVAHVSDLRWLP